jgi:nucleotide-binding universal stress UspA family protein
MKLAVLLSAGHPFPEAALNQAAKLAKTLDLPLTGIISSEQGLDYYPMGEGGLIDVMQEKIEQDDKRILDCVKRFQSICRNHDLAQDWHGRHGFIRQEWASLSPYFDLVMVPAPFSAPEIANLGLSATLQIQNDALINGFDQRCVIAWDGSLPAGRALRAALPLLPRFEQVDVISVDAKTRSLPTDIGTYLAANGITATITTEVSGDDSVADLILEQARNADLLVMGAFGGSMMMEKLFGGVTEAVYSTGTTPVLYAH